MDSRDSRIRLSSLLISEPLLPRAVISVELLNFSVLPFLLKRKLQVVVTQRVKFLDRTWHVGKTVYEVVELSLQRDLREKKAQGRL